MATLYHYCSNDAFINIIKSREIWASEFTLSNDILEGKWIWEVVQKYCNDVELRAYQQSIFLTRLDILISMIGGAGICLSKRGDLLSQWRAYSDNGSGVSIGFDESCFGVEGSQLPKLEKVIYDPQTQVDMTENKLRLVVELIESGAGGPRPQGTLACGPVSQERLDEHKRLELELLEALLALFPSLYIFKNPAFQEEEEWRTITVVNGNAAGAYTFMPSMDFRALPDRIVPYKAFSLDTDLNRQVITEVKLGPRNITPPHVVEAAMERHRWRRVPVNKSTASYR